MKQTGFTKRWARGRERPLMMMVLQSYILILYEWAIWCAKGRVYCTFTPKRRYNLTSKEHQCRAMKGTRHTIADSWTTFKTLLPFKKKKNALQLNNLRCMMGIDFTLLLFLMCLFCFDISPCVCDLAIRNKIRTCSRATELFINLSIYLFIYFYHPYNTEQIFLLTKYLI